MKAAEKTFFGHPWGLATLFGTEMWERFSFYGMRAILAAFLMAPAVRSGLGLPETTAFAIVGVYQGMVYLTALPGGWLADRVLGARRAVLLGGVIIMCGHISMAIPVTSPVFVYLGLLLIVSAPACSSRTSPAWSATSTGRTRTPGATRGSRCSTWASTSARWPASA